MLDRIDVEKDRGVLVSHNLSWNNHVDLISSKAQRMLNVLYRTYRDILNDISTKKLPILLGFVRAFNMLGKRGMVSSYQTKHQQFGTISTQGYKIHSWKGIF